MSLERVRRDLENDLEALINQLNTFVSYGHGLLTRESAIADLEERISTIEDELRALEKAIKTQKEDRDDLATLR